MTRIRCPARRPSYSPFKNPRHERYLWISSKITIESAATPRSAPAQVQFRGADRSQTKEQLVVDSIFVNAQLDGLAHPQVAQGPVPGRILQQVLLAGRVQFWVAQVEQKSLGAGAGRVHNDHSLPRLSFRQVGLAQVPHVVELAGLDKLLAHLAALDPAQDEGIQVGLALRLPQLIVLVAHQRHVVAGDPLFHHERS